MSVSVTLQHCASEAAGPLPASLTFCCRLGGRMPATETHAADPPDGQSGREEGKMGHSEFDPATRERRPWNAGRIVGAHRALKPQQVWAIRFWLDRKRRVRDRALFDRAIDSKDATGQL